jgi:anti-anti-sigma factor
MPGMMKLRPAGELDITQAARLQSEWFPEVDDRGPELVIVDLSDVTFLDVCGLRVIAGLLQRQRARGASLAVSNAPAIVLHLLRATSLSELMDTVEAFTEPC